MTCFLFRRNSYEASKRPSILHPITARDGRMVFSGPQQLPAYFLYAIGNSELEHALKADRRLFLAWTGFAR